MRDERFDLSPWTAEEVAKVALAVDPRTLDDPRAGRAEGGRVSEATAYDPNEDDGQELTDRVFSNPAVVAAIDDLIEERKRNDAPALMTQDELRSLLQ